MLDINVFLGADLLVDDCQYTVAEMKSRMVWGHSSFEYAIGTANQAGVKRLALFHHDLDWTDQQIDEMAADYCASGRYGDTKVFFARE